MAPTDLPPTGLTHFIATPSSVQRNEPVITQRIWQFEHGSSSNLTEFLRSPDTVETIREPDLMPDWAATRFVFKDGIVTTAVDPFIKHPAQLSYYEGAGVGVSVNERVQLMSGLRSLAAALSAQDAKLDVLQSRVDMLTATVRPSAHVTAPAEGRLQFEDTATPTAAIVFGLLNGLIEPADALKLAAADLPTFFDELADADQPGTPIIVDAATQGLESGSAKLRAAAGRALLVLDPQNGCRKVEQALAGESNRMTSAIMRGALAAAKA
jgi:hypothetical protein